MPKIGVYELILALMVVSLSACGICVLSWIMIEIAMWRSGLAEKNVYVLPVLYAWLWWLLFLAVVTGVFAVHEAKPTWGLHGVLWRAMVALDVLLKGADADVAQREA